MLMLTMALVLYTVQFCPAYQKVEGVDSIVYNSRDC